MTAHQFERRFCLSYYLTPRPRRGVYCVGEKAYSAGKTAVIATGQGIYWTGNKAKELVESGEFYVAPIENDHGGAISVGIRWNF